MGLRFPEAVSRAPADRFDAVRLRESSAQDSDLLAAIHRQCFPNYWNPDAFTDFFAVAGTFALLAAAESPPHDPMGMVVYRTSFEQADIITLAVLPQWRRAGLGGMLLSAAMQQSLLRGCKTMFLDVEEGNVAALRLYEGFGFAHVSRRRLYYRQKDGSFTDALVMSKKLR
jgi:ribosomal-protein-alanine N-acetyltransferase